VRDEKLVEKWNILTGIRNDVLKALEIARQERFIGNALEAAVRIAAPSPYREVLLTYEKSLPFIFIVSQVHLEEDMREGWKSEKFEGVTIKVEKAAGEKCPRCWNYSLSVGSDARYPDFCGRCADIVTRINS